MCRGRPDGSCDCNAELGGGCDGDVDANCDDELGRDRGGKPGGGCICEGMHGCGGLV